MAQVCLLSFCLVPHTEPSSRDPRGSPIGCGAKRGRPEPRNVHNVRMRGVEGEGIHMQMWRAMTLVSGTLVGLRGSITLSVSAAEVGRLKEGCGLRVG